MLLSSDAIPIYVSGMVKVLGLGDPVLALQWAIQVKVILDRMLRSHIRPEVTKAWVDSCEKLNILDLLAEPAIVCGLVGCETVVVATMMCGRCKVTYYCSAECQKSYVALFLWLSSTRLCSFDAD